ncbi:hypothetical protein ABT297_04220 [Dactylosporangium sp. NPDC000555]|uniref:hypothetical protein n=1 Tax=Dactylosporangium sp. NPDC000555 TaxID=3154260 RepID=UPI00332AF6B6
MAPDDTALIASHTRRRVTTVVLHLPDPDVTGRPYCPWAGSVEATTVTEALKLRAVGCNLCPQIKARRTSP